MSDVPADAPGSPAGSTGDSRASQTKEARIERLRPYMWVPGAPSPNPTGRPKTKRFRAALEAYFAAHPEEFAEVIERVVTDAKEAKDADPGRRFLRDTIDGPLETRLAGPDGEKLDVQVTMELHDSGTDEGGEAGSS